MAATRTPASFTVGWVCALPIELAAAQMIMDEEYEDLPSLPSATNTYTYGRVGIHQVVAACLPAGQTGNNSAAAVAAEMRHTFPSMRFAVLVGIGGGVPTEEHDIRLGDVVISQPTGRYGGVVQFDLGKTGRGGQITRTGSLDAPPRILLTALAKLRANIYRGMVHIRDHLSVFSNSPVFVRPQSEEDVLYPASSEHVSGATCARCKKDDVISRNARETQDPALFFGTIASGNQVMKDAPTRDSISQNLDGILCFEMEAAGLMNNFPCLVIRGISDYADMHKNKQWQPYAAATAAAYGKELLGIVPQLDSGTRNSQNDGLESNQRPNSAMLLRPQESIDCLRSLSFREQDYRSQDIVFAKDTCQWLLRDPDYRDWIRKSNGLFWIKGNPGAGKSALMKFAVTTMESKQPQDLVLSFFVHGQGKELQKSPLGIFRALLNKMLSTFPQRLSKLTERFEDRERRFGSYQEDRWEWSAAELQDFMSETLISGTKGLHITIFVDALDECGEHDAKALLNYFLDLMRQAEQEKGHLRICFSSRHYPILWPNTIPTISVEDHNNMDIQLVVHQKLKQIECPMSRWKIEQRVSSKSQGGFQWAVLVTDRVVDGDLAGTDESILHEILTTIPGTLDELYADILSASTRVEKAQTVKLFQWILFAKRPLSLQELREALATDKDMTYETVAQLRRHNRWGKTSSQFEKYVKNISKGLVEFQTRELWEQHEPEGELWDREAQFIHQSVADHVIGKFLHGDKYAQSTTQTIAGAGHFQISRSCLRYITLSDVLAGTCLPRSSLSARFPLAPFAVQFLFYHIQKVEQEGIHQLDLLPLIHWDQQSDFLQQIASFWQILDPDCIHAPKGWPFVGATQLHVAIAFGSKSAFDALLQMADTDVNGRDSHGNTPLLLAIRESYSDMALMLLSRSPKQRLAESQSDDGYSSHTQSIKQHETSSVDINAENDDSDTPLNVALETGDREVILRLLEEGAKLRFLSEETKLVYYAIRHKDKILLMHLIKKDVDLNGAVHFVLQEMSHDDKDNDLEAILSELLIAGAKTTRSWSFDTFANNNHDSNSDTDVIRSEVDDDDNDDEAILVASRRGQLSAVRLLLLHGISASYQSRTGQTPLHLASYGGHLEIVRLLIEKGINPNIPIRNGETPLHTALHQGHLQVARLLIENAADPNIPFHEGRTPLQFVLQHEHFEVARLLIENGADPNIPFHDGETPLYLVIRRGHFEVARLLIENGADPNIPIRNGETLLFSASQRGHLEEAKMLIKIGADLNIPNRQGKTPLLSAVQHWKLEVARLLIENGADPSLADKCGKTPLLSAIQYWKLEIAKLLIDKGANPNLADKYGNAPLGSAVHLEQFEMIRLLIEKGVNPNVAAHHCGSTPLACALNSWNLRIAELLLDMGANPNTASLDGRRPLEVASERGHLAVTRLLLERGADPNIANLTGQTPLCLAFAKGHFEVVRLLLGKGVDPNSESDNGGLLFRRAFDNSTINPVRT